MRSFKNSVLLLLVSATIAVVAENPNPLAGSLLRSNRRPGGRARGPRVRRDHEAHAPSRRNLYPEPSRGQRPQR